MYCVKCGMQLPADAIFCQRCGERVYRSSGNYNQRQNYNTAYQQYSYSPTLHEQVKASIATRELISGIIWCCIAVLQLLAGLLHVVVFFVGVWNLINAIMRITRSSAVKNTPGRQIYRKYYDNLANIIVFAIINVLLGGIIGIVAIIFDACTRQYVLNNREILECPEAN